MSAPAPSAVGIADFNANFIASKQKFERVIYPNRTRFEWHYPGQNAQDPKDDDYAEELRLLREEERKRNLICESYALLLDIKMNDYGERPSCLTFLLHDFSIAYIDGNQLLINNDMTFLDVDRVYDMIIKKEEQIQPTEYRPQSDDDASSSDDDDHIPILPLQSVDVAPPESVIKVACISIQLPRNTSQLPTFTSKDDGDRTVSIDEFRRVCEGNTKITDSFRAIPLTKHTIRTE